MSYGDLSYMGVSLICGGWTTGPVSYCDILWMSDGIFTGISL